MDENGKSWGKVSRDQALFLAHDKGLDLVLVGGNPDLPVGKIMDFGKYKYQLEKEERKRRAHSKEQKIKEIRLSLKIGEHDSEIKAERAKNFLLGGDKVKVTLRLKGREMMFSRNGFDLLKKFKDMSGGKFEKEPQMLGRIIYAIITRQN